MEAIQVVGTVEYADCHSAQGVKPHPNEYPAYDLKHGDVEVRFLELKGMWSIPLLPLLLGQLWPEVIVHNKV